MLASSAGLAQEATVPDAAPMSEAMPAETMPDETMPSASAGAAADAIADVFSRSEERV